jgi:phosphate uptake regulator
MFHWLTGGEKTGEVGLREMRLQFVDMVSAGRHAFDIATAAFLGQTESETIQRDLFKTDKRINKAERRIRRELVVHATVHGVAEFPPCLVLMSIVKDAERMGDLAKNMFDLTELAPQAPSGEHCDTLVSLRERILPLLQDCCSAVEHDDREQAVDVIVKAKETEDQCDSLVADLIGDSQGDAMAPTYVLAYRYFKRMASHCRNIASSVVQPVHKLDFTSKIVAEEEEEDEESAEH